jgi:hypothetical protein
VGKRYGDSGAGAARAAVPAVLVAAALAALPSAGVAGATGGSGPGAAIGGQAAHRATSITAVLGPAKPGQSPDPARWVTGNPSPAPRPAVASPGTGTGTGTRTGAGPATHATKSGQETLNWSGEMSTGTTYSTITGSWVVPAVSASQGTQYSATWIGIGGGSASATGLLQTGTEQDSGTASTTYSAWVEMLPAPAFTIVTATTGRPAPVVPGDHIHAEISHQASGTWRVVLSDTTEEWAFAQTFDYTGTTVTAEWIEEAPTVNTQITTLADFHSVEFTDMQTVEADPAAASLVSISLIESDQTVIAYPGTVRPTTTRSVTVYYSPPATPVSPGTASGYDLVGADGGVFVFDPPAHSGGFYGSLPSIRVVPNQPIVGIVPTVDDRGYFLVAADGGVFSFGNAPYLGSLPGIHVVPNARITGIVAANTDRGYFLVGSDGGVFSFGTVPFLGSLPGDGVHVNDIVGIAATPTGNGYWLIASTGQVYAFGAAQQLGTPLGTSSPVSAIAGTPTGGGYWVTTRNGTVYAFGKAKSFGTLPAIHVTPNRPIIGIVHTDGTQGYWLVGSDGGIFAFGNADFIGALPSVAQVDDIVGAVATTVS